MPDYVILICVVGHSLEYWHKSFRLVPQLRDGGYGSASPHIPRCIFTLVCQISMTSLEHAENSETEAIIRRLQFPIQHSKSMVAHCLDGLTGFLY